MMMTDIATDMHRKPVSRAISAATTTASRKAATKDAKTIPSTIALRTGGRRAVDTRTGWDRETFTSAAIKKATKMVSAPALKASRAGAVTAMATEVGLTAVVEDTRARPLTADIAMVQPSHARIWNMASDSIPIRGGGTTIWITAIVANT